MEGVVIMRVVIEDELKEYMQKHNHDSISLQLSNRRMRNANALTTKRIRPRIKYHQPKNVESFDKYNVDDIAVYVDKNLKTKDDTIKFVAEKTLGIKRCHVQGLDVSNMN